MASPGRTSPSSRSSPRRPRSSSRSRSSSRRFDSSGERGRHDRVEVARRAGGDAVQHAVAGRDDELVVEAGTGGKSLHHGGVEADDVAELIEIAIGRQGRIGGDDHQLAIGSDGVRQVGRRGRGRHGGGNFDRRGVITSAGSQKEEDGHKETPSEDTEKPGRNASSSV